MPSWALDGNRTKEGTIVHIAPSPIAGSTLVADHRHIRATLLELCKGTGWSPKMLYIAGSAWVLDMEHPERKPVQIVVDVGDRDMLVLKVQAML